MYSSPAAIWYRRLVFIALALTFVVVVLGAWVRLTDAGLGCPDWPGCYGTLGVPTTSQEIEQAAEAYPERPLEPGKAWREMIHRYFASTLGMVIVLMAAAALANRRDPKQPTVLPVALVLLVIAQGLLGMLTVTWLLKPVIVLAHLLGGMTTLGLLGWLQFSLARAPHREGPAPGAIALLGCAALVGLALQIALGGWTSANYAALACPDFPTCQTQWWPEMDAAEGFVLWRGLGTDYEGGVLDNPARIAIHMAHRVGALLVTIVLGALILLTLMRSRDALLRRAAMLVAVALCTQVAIGVSIVLESLPLALATAHNGVAALLLLSLVYFNNIVHRRATSSKR